MPLRHLDPLIPPPSSVATEQFHIEALLRTSARTRMHRDHHLPDVLQENDCQKIGRFQLGSVQVGFGATFPMFAASFSPLLLHKEKEEENEEKRRKK